MESLETRCLLSAGSLDTSFDVLEADGKVTTPIGASADEVRALAVQPDGKIVVAGRSLNGSNYDFALARYNANGSLDTGFGTGGKVTTAISATRDDEAYAIAIQTDGHIVVAGRAALGANNFDVALARYTTSGTLDTSFGTGGKITTAISTNSNDEAYGVALQADGKIVVAGRAKLSNNANGFDIAVVRYDTSGNLDTTFDSDGKLTTAIGTKNDEAYAVAIQADQKIVVAGRASIGGAFDFVAVRYTPSGSLDTSFDSDGQVTTKFGGGADEAFAIALQTDGKIVLAGRAINGTNTDFALVRYNTGGSLDTSFDSDGKLTTALGSGADEAYALAVQSDGKIVAAGLTFNGTNNDFAVVRYSATGSLDNGFGSSGMVATDFGLSTDEAYALAIQSDAKIVVAGRATISSTFDFALARYEARNSPVAIADSYSVNENNVLNVAATGVLSNDSDADGDSLTAVLVSGPAHGSLTLNANGSFTYTPIANYNGSDAFTYQANDGSLNSITATVSLTVNSVNNAPVSVANSYSVNEDNTLTVAAAGLLTNDSDVDGNPLTAVLVTGPAKGTLTLNANGSFSYTPSANYNGSDSFTYKANDGSLDSAAAIVSITINAVNDAPTSSADSYSLSEDSSLTVSTPGVLGNDSDVEGSPLTAVLVTGPAHGSLTLNSNGSFTYTPTANYNGGDSFTYMANDGGLDSNTATVSLTVNPVNDAPVAVNNNFSVNEDNALTVAASGVLSNDSDVDGDTLTASLLGSPAHGSLTLAGNGSFTYTPVANFNGSDSFTYQVSDGTTQSNVATVSITVTAVNDAPVGGGDTYGITEDTPRFVAAPGVLSNDIDVDGDPLTVMLVTGPAHGALSLSSNGSFTYTPTTNYNGSDSFTYKVNDSALDSDPVTVTLSVGAANDPPMAVADSYSLNEDATFNVSALGVLANDIDADGNSLTALLVTSPAHGTLTLNSNGSFSYTPDANYNGSDSFQYQSNDGIDNSNIATVSLTISPVNDAPVAGADSYSVNEDTTLTVSASGVLSNDSDVDGDTLTAALVSGPAHGSLTLNANGSFSYTPTANYNGGDSFTYKAHDGTLNSNTVTVSITINAVNDAPVATVNSYSVNEDTTLNVAASGVLGNDSDVDGNSLTAVVVSGPAHGTLSFNANGSFTYTPVANFNGSDSFQYQASDGALNSNIATVSITVNPVNDAPVASADSYSVNEDNTLTVSASGVLSNDSDVDGDSFTAILVSGPAHGSLTLNANGSFSFTPTANYSGGDSFTYKANDGALNSNTVTVSLTINAVNDAPTAASNSYSVNEDTALTVSAAGVLANDSDVDGDPLTAVLVTSPAHGSLTLNANGSFSYTPNANFNGSDSFTYKASDGPLVSSAATVTVTVQPVNDAPSAGDGVASVPKNGVLNVPGSGVLDSVIDVDGDSLTAVLVTGPASGILNLNSTGSYQYTPNLNFSGTDTFSYKANDGLLDSNAAVITITVNGSNTAPVTVNNTYTVNEDIVLTDSSPGVLGNDSDLDDDTLNTVLVSSSVNGSLTLNANGSFSYTPNANFSGSDSFTYQATDGALFSNVSTVSITVNAVNDAPVAVGNSYSVNEDNTLTVAAFGVLGNDTDVEGSSLTAVLVTGPANGSLTLNANGSLSYTPNANFNGSDSFTYKANDGTLDSNVSTVSITVNAVNDAPVAVGNSYSVNEDNTLNVSAAGVLGNDSDVDGDSLTAVLVAGPAHGSVTLNANGSFSFTPDANFNGSDSFTYKANDGALDSNVATVSITVNAVNDAPVAVGNSYSVDEDNTLNVSAAGVLGNDSDVDGDSLTAVLVSGPAHGSVTLNANGSFSFTPDANFNGSDSFTYKANDGAVDSNVATVSLTVNAVNDAPVAADNSYSVNEDNTLNVSAASVLGNDSDVDGDSLTAVLVSGPAHGSLTFNANGSFSFTPDANFNGSDSFTYKANDGAVDSNVATVSITVNAVNDAPVAVGNSYSVNEDNTLNVSAVGVLGNDSDVDGDSLTAVLVTGPAHGSLTLNANGSLSYTPDSHFNGSDSFTYQGNDGALGSNVSTVMITVNQVNEYTPPTVTLTAPSLTNDATPSVTIVASDAGSGVVGATVWLDIDLNNDGDFSDTIGGRSEQNYASGTLSSGTVAFDVSSALSSGAFRFRARVRDAAGNEGTSSPQTVVIDTVAPTATLTPVTSVTYDVDFSEAVSGVDLGDFALTRNGLSVALTAGLLSGGGSAYSLNLGTVANSEGTYVLTLNNSGTGIIDSAGNPLTGSATGVWLITSTSVVVSGGVVTVTDVLNTTNDDIVLSIHGANLRIAYEGIFTEIPRAGLSQLTINSGAGDDTLTLDFGGGPLPFNITFNGGEGGNDALKITNLNTAFNAYTLNNSNAHDGLILFRNGGLVTSQLIFTGLEPLFIDGTPTEIVLNLTSADDSDATLLDIGGDDGFMRLSGSTFESLDFSIAAATSITINGFDGNDNITVQSIDATYTGSLTINGDAGNDTLNAAASQRAVTLQGGDDNDSLTGSRGNDSLDGGIGDDVLGSGAGNDTLRGGLGDDTLMGGFGTDRLIETGAGTLTLKNTSLTGIGSDVLSEVEQAELSGGHTKDLLDASAFNLGSVTLLGMGGNDTLISGGRADKLDGGDKTDTVWWNAPNSKTSLAVIISGDTASSTLSSNGVIDVLIDVESVSVISGAGRDTLDGSHFSGPVTLIGSDGDDLIYGSLAGGFLNGMNGKDFIIGGDMDETILGGSANDTLIGNGGNDFIKGQSHSDSIDGGAGDDTLYGEGDGNTPAGNDSIRGGAGQDSIAGGAGNDTLLGEGDDDTLVGEDGLDDLAGGDGNDLLNGGGLSSNPLANTSTDGNDRMLGGLGDDTLWGGAGNDLLDGGDGNDRLDGQGQNDTVLGGRGDDSLSGSAGNDTVLGGDGNDTLDGGAGLDKLAGQGGRNLILNATAGEINEAFTFNSRFLLV